MGAQNDDGGNIQQGREDRDDGIDKTTTATTITTMGTAGHGEGIAGR
jgi:hypothetical protein